MYTFLLFMPLHLHPLSVSPHQSLVRPVRVPEVVQRELQLLQTDIEHSRGGRQQIGVVSEDLQRRHEGEHNIALDYLHSHLRPAPVVFDSRKHILVLLVVVIHDAIAFICTPLHLDGPC